MANINKWHMKLETAALIIGGVSINYIGKLITSKLKLPLSLDSIGTVLSSMLAGPIVGAVSGAINNIIYGLTADPILLMYGITSIAIGITCGMMVRRGWTESIWKVFGIGVALAVVTSITSTPINTEFWCGYTGNTWGDTLYTLLIARKFPVGAASFLDELIAELPDKILVVFIAYGIIKILSGKISVLYRRVGE